MTDAEHAQAVEAAVRVFNRAAKNAREAGLEVDADYHRPEKMEVFQREPLYVGGGLTALVSRPVAANA